MKTFAKLKGFETFISSPLDKKTKSRSYLYLNHRLEFVFNFSRDKVYMDVFVDKNSSRSFGLDIYINKNIKSYDFIYDVKKIELKPMPTSVDEFFDLFINYYERTESLKSFK